MKTPWLDVVRNLYTAIWFATCDEPGNTRSAYGWISLYANTRKELRVIDLWGRHSSKHFRPHMQQGLSLAMQPDDAPTPRRQQEFNKYRIARVRFRRSGEWDLAGHMFSRRFLFPCQRNDDSLRQLSDTAVQDVIVATCVDHGLDDRALGLVGGCLA